MSTTCREFIRYTYSFQKLYNSNGSILLNKHKNHFIPIQDHFAKHGKINLQLKGDYSFITFVDFEPSRFWGVDLDGKNLK